MSKCAQDFWNTLEEEKTMLKMIERRKKRWHVARHEGMLKQTLEGRWKEEEEAGGEG